MTTSKKQIFFVIGPTSCGKTAMSLELARSLPTLSPPYKGGGPTGEIISADSRQVYRDFNLSSGKVTAEEMGNIPHHMLDIVDPGEYFSVVDFTELALNKIEEIYSRGNIPIICGGTGFYIDSVLYKYELPEAKINEELRHRLNSKSTDELFKILRYHLLFPFPLFKFKYFFKNLGTLKRFSKPEYRKNPHRLVRAIEIVKELGHFPVLRKAERFESKEFEVKILQPEVSPDVLKEKIYKRLLERLEQGMIEEVKNVKEKYNLSFEYLEGLGLEFKWTAKYLKGEVSKDEMIEKLYLEICQYAKRQRSWFRRYLLDTFKKK